MTPWPEPVRLEGRHVVLEPLSPRHAPALAAASAEGELWRLWYTAVPKPDEMEAAIAARLRAHEAGQGTPFAILSRQTGEAVGMTSYLNPVPPPVRRVEIGSTWLRRSAQRTPFNTEAKRLLLGHAFEALGCIAVEFRTSFLNHQSRRAIERLGAKLDGILRNHYAPSGDKRDTCVYSVIDAEWPLVRRHLDHQLERSS